MKKSDIIPLISVCLFSSFLTACTDEKNDQEGTAEAPSNIQKSEVQSSNKNQFQYTGKLGSNEKTNESPLLKAYRDRVKQALRNPVPVLLIDSKSLSDNENKAQEIALKDKRFTKFIIHPEIKMPLRNEIMTIRPVLASDKTNTNKKSLTNCQPESCFRVEMYNYFYNLSSVAFVDNNKSKVLAITQYSNAQPDLNKDLIQIANEIAKGSKLVQAELKEAGGLKINPTMSEIKTSLKNSRCERSHHLCVAPTFVVGNKALWAIVDLTDGDLVGTRWTELGSSGPPIEITERKLENEYVFSQFCEKSTHFEKDDWQYDYQITSSDGLQLTNVKFKNRLVMKSVKLLDWHVSYSSRENFGYSDAIGCPLFSSAVVIAYDGPQTEAINEKNKPDSKGFAFFQDFRQPPWPTPCNYRYEQRFEFYSDGRFRVAMADFGRGCGTDGTYRPVVRIDIEASDTEGKSGIEQFSQWDGTAWKSWDKEQWNLQEPSTKYTDEGYLFKVTNPAGKGFYIEPNRGQFTNSAGETDGSKGDFAYTYVTVNHSDKDEARSDMMTIGSCCNTNHEQGPELFMQPAEPLDKQNLVMWYVPQIKNEGAKGSEYCWADTRVEDGIPKIKVWPCYAGPMFIPTQ
ncbi:MAG: hypothetical protein V3V19_07710 [Cocleimonas sp.]